MSQKKAFNVKEFVGKMLRNKKKIIKEWRKSWKTGLKFREKKAIIVIWPQIFTKKSKLISFIKDDISTKNKMLQFIS